MKLLSLKWLFFFHLLGGCAAGKITLVSNEKAKVSVLEFEDSGGEGEIIGETPLTVEVAKLENKLVKVWGDEFLPQYWIYSPIEDEKTEISLNLSRIEIPEEPTPAEVMQNLNRYFRMLIRAYKALSSKEWQLSRELSKQLVREVPEAAAPHVITGLSYLSEGNTAQAKSAFLKAKNLDPTDKDIEELIDLVQ
ncbi:MAG: hypothetical protein OXT67_07825 [Zetaproteobacteria bacterium]|nr:hypothetical protein [Zetaproteobacteria bacterium]